MAGENLAIAILSSDITLSNSQNIEQQDKSTPTIGDRQSTFFNDDRIDRGNTHLLLSQVNSVESLQDVKPTDWSYEALRGLIDRYGCINGFPDFTYRGDQTISRAEFVAGLNSCLNKIENILTNSDRMPQNDVETVLRLMQEFQSDLAILQGRTDGNQARVEDLEAIQFSTTTKLQGEAVIALGDVLSSDSETNTILGSRLRMDLITSFSGNDLLFTRLSRNDFPGFVEEAGTFQGNLSFADSDGDDFELEELRYSFGVNENLDLIVGATGVDAADIAGTINVLDGDGGSGSISTFGTRNPIYNPPRDAGVGVVHRPLDRVEISAGYLASPANESASGGGLFNGTYSALGQIEIEPFDSLSLAATYVHSYNQSDTETGTNKANLKSTTTELFGEETPTISNSYGLELSWAISDGIVIGGWGGLSKVSNLSTLDRQIDRGTQDVWNWTATLAFPDLGKEGSMGGIVVGSEPTATNSTIENLEIDSDRSLHLEAFYQYQVSDNIAITPGVIWITEPDSNIQNSDDLVIGTVRTTFSF
ncbi:carbohydrate porin [Waterburya agarophytonicola K14]|uniref:Carbohydrate porin n=2 Tax=Waterburya TaxID=2886915 RepID=A0A964BUT2_9CYAN|nr:carbohydrate porin [Waterburya agarophytonicola KI4]